MKPYVPYTSRFGPEQYGRECDPTYRLEEHIASLRDTNPKRWAQLNAQWNQP